MQGNRRDIQIRQMGKLKVNFISCAGGFYRVAKLTILSLAISLSVGCVQNGFEQSSGFVPEAGDLLFQDTDCGPFCDAIEKVTTGYRGANLTHVGIVSKDDGGELVVIEAVSKGVSATPLQSFLGRSSDANRRPKVLAGRLKPDFRHLIPAAIKEARALTGKAYDKVFDVNNDSYYCSELIYEIFLRANSDKPVFELQPMTFKDPDTGDIFGTWQKYYSELGVPVPEGRLGINPGGISRSPVLDIVRAYGICDGWENRETFERQKEGRRCLIQSAER